MKRVFAWLIPSLLAPAVAAAVATQSFVVDTSDGFEKGKLEGTAVHGDGKVTRAITTKRTVIDGAATAYASALGPDGAIYVGTGNQGNIYRIDDKGHTLFARCDAPLVSSLVWVGDTLYAGTLERGKVLAIDRKGAVRDYATLTGAQHVWALAYDAPRATLYAATGPEGKLFALDKDAKQRVAHDDQAEHLLSLAVDGEGRSYVGTSNGARLVRIVGGKASVLYDAPGQELTTLVLAAGYVAIASNDFTDSGGIDLMKDSTRGRKSSRAGKGKVFGVSLEGSVEELYRSDSAHITALEVDTNGDALLVGLGQEGHVVRAKRGQLPVTWADADERQVVALHLTAKQPHFVSSDGVAVYRLTDASARGQWTSAVLDAKMPARFGELSFRKRGTVHFSTRSGNTDTPDDSWSTWSPELTQSAPIRSPAARFLQVRASLEGDAELYAVQAFYLAQNQPAYVRNVRANIDRSSDKPAATKAAITLNWDIENPDGDRLRYRVFFKREGNEAYLPLLREDELLDKTELKWDSLAVPDGFYRVRVEASDELATPPPFALKSEAISAPILVDNHAPQLANLQLKGVQLSGQANDTLGPISQLELSIDGQPFFPLSAHDGLLDTARESFTVDLRNVPAGRHIFTVRAYDAVNNSSTSALEADVKH